MTEISSYPSLRGTQGHQSIGSGGSFWLPPKMKAENFEANFKKYSSSEKASKSDNINPSIKHSVVKNNPSLNLLTKSKSSQEQAANKPGEKNYIKSKNSEASSIKMEQSVAKLKSSSSPFIIRPIKTPFNNSLTTSQPLILDPKASANSLLGVFPHLDLKTKGGKYILLNSSSSSGTGNAPDAFNYDDSYFKRLLDDTSLPTWKFKEPISEEVLIDEIRSFLSDSSFRSSYHHGVARFAFSMENGSSVSVRIQQMKENFQICFICEDKNSLLSLSQRFSASVLNSNPNNLPPQLYFFSSYKEMDHALSPQNHPQI